MSVANTIPAADYVTINPSVLSAGGNPPSLSGLYLDNGGRVPIGTVQSFGSALAVSAYFGSNSIEYTDASTYFAGFTTKTQTPGALLFAQYPTAAVPAWLRGGSLAALTLAQLQAIAPGTLTIAVDGASWTSSSINLSAATSFSNAATTIQSALAINDGSFTGVIVAGTSAFTGVLAGGVLTTTAVTGPIVPGATLSGTSVTAGTLITSQLTGTAGGAGTYQTNGTQTLGSESMTSANAAVGVLTVSALTGIMGVGQIIAGSTTAAGTIITAGLSGTTGTGSYIVSPSQAVGSAALTSGAAVVTWDSILSAFTITGGTPGVAGAIAFPTTNALATALALTAATGAVTSQGSAPATPAAFMNALIGITQNWATFSPNFEPVTADKEAFALWTSGQNGQFAYALDSTDITLTQSNDSASALYNIIANGYSGTIPSYQPSYLHTSAFVMGMIASINFGVRGGRISLAYKSSSLLTPGVTTLTAAQNLEANGCNYYGAVSNPANNWNYYFPGSITGPFKWADSYVNQIWLNQSLQTALVTLLTQVNSIPYNQAGYDLISAACNGPIQQGVLNGVITAGVTLSAAQALEVNTAAGFPIDAILSTRGWYLIVGPATPTQRAARSSPPCTLYYCDGGSVNRINLASILVQ